MTTGQYHFNMRFTISFHAFTPLIECIRLIIAVTGYGQPGKGAIGSVHLITTPFLGSNPALLQHS
ncbi:hypothetical protein M431DRAFT_502934 [Trichoderma harzianum CBS 226.95]|uniref:Uncharacterized protein n=1 Tax=Trichoderma harzianum CBS 226.95 TaxID=983964 RepID=A0A2T4AUN3_TRIHA|nr:hypothetical protein M431DRAFT_502934 [Trichoderma harzianum CBS 226.95]PTB60773.1 hypothetical protein M431DRAFT_502934 [Trichoderma harzianum CBS 226.95]